MSRAPTDAPELYAHQARSLVGDSQAFGVDEAWVAPVGVFTTPAGFGEEAWMRAVPATLIAKRLSGGQVTCRHGRFDGRRSGASSMALQVAGTPNHYTATSAIRFAQVYLPNRLIDRVADGLRPGARMSGALRDDLIFRADGALEDMVDRYVAACLSGASALEQEARATLLVAVLLRTHHGLGARPPQARGGLAGWQLRRACEAMDARLDGAIGLEMLAGVAGCSPSHFSRAFKVSTGVALMKSWKASRGKMPVSSANRQNSRRTRNRSRLEPE